MCDPNQQQLVEEATEILRAALDLPIGPQADNALEQAAQAFEAADLPEDAVNCRLWKG